MEANLTNISYIAFRLAPFIIVCFFTLESFLNWNLKGVVYLFGLLFACVLTMLAGNMLGLKDPDSPNVDTNICSSISLGPSGSPLSKLPLSTAVFSYTFFYLVTFIINVATPNGKGFSLDKGKKNPIKLSGLQNAMTQNTPTMILFPLLLLIDAGWNLMNNCTKIEHIIGACILSGTVGIAWASVITNTLNPDLMYISNIMGDVCSKPTATTFRCRTRKSDGTAPLDSPITKSILLKKLTDIVGTIPINPKIISSASAWGASTPLTINTLSDYILQGITYASLPNPDQPIPDVSVGGVTVKSVYRTNLSTTNTIGPIITAYNKITEDISRLESGDIPNDIASAINDEITLFKLDIQPYITYATNMKSLK